MPPKPPRLVAIPLPPPFLLPRPLLAKTLSFTAKRSFGIRSLDRRPKYSKYNVLPNDTHLLSTPEAAFERRIAADTLPLRTGALAIKKGMTGIYDPESGERIPCTVLQLDRNQVVSHKTKDVHGYYAVCVGSGHVPNANNVTKPLRGHFSAQGIPLKRHQREFRVRGPEGLVKVGEAIKADWFIEGQFVDTRSNCKGKGFQGVMKRWGMHGQDRSHGASLSHRSMGSAGQGQGGGSRVYPGKKMAGNMGGQRNTVQNLKVLLVDSEKGIVVVNGAVSGPKGTLVMVQDALKKAWPKVPERPEAQEAVESPQEATEKLGEAAKES